MRDHLKTFLEHLRYNRNVSAHTIRAYDSDISQFLTFLAAEKQTKISALSPADLDPALVRAFIASLGRGGEARSTMARKLSGLRTFFRYLRREEILDGAKKIIARDRPGLLLELLSGTHADPGSYAGDICETFGYDCFVVQKGERLPGLPTIASLGKNTSWGTEIETRNVLFLPR